MKSRFYSIGFLLAGFLSASFVLAVEGRSAQFGGDEDYSLILPDLYLGGFVAEPPPGTKAVLNLCDIKDPYKCEVHVWEPVKDGDPNLSLKWLSQGVKFIDKNRKAGRPVYVHCILGKSRSATVVIAYVMFKNGWSLEKSLAFVKSKRPITNPNPAFMKLLRQWEKSLE